MLPGKLVWVGASAVAGSVLIVSAWPAAAHWVKQASGSAGAAQADARGLAAADAGREAGTGRPAAGRPAGEQPAGGRGRVAGAQARAASQQPQLIKVAVAGRPGRHRKPVRAAPQAPVQVGYLNPLRGVTGLVPERVDQGVDFGGSGPVYALGDAVVTSAADGDSGWPGGGWITYQLTDGPDRGLVVYLAEDVTPAVAVGQHVSSSTVIASMFAGADGIETGWAAASTEFTPEAQLPEAGGVGASGPFPTRVGVSFDDLLQSVGAPAAPNVTQPAYGILPPGYPGN